MIVDSPLHPGVENYPVSRDGQDQPTASCCYLQRNWRRLAGVPKPVIERARQLLSELAVHHVGHNRAARNRRKEDEAQLPLFNDPGQELLKALAVSELEKLTPVQAFDLVRQWKEKFAPN